MRKQNRLAIRQINKIIKLRHNQFPRTGLVFERGNDVTRNQINRVLPVQSDRVVLDENISGVLNFDAAGLHVDMGGVWVGAVVAMADNVSANYYLRKSTLGEGDRRARLMHKLKSAAIDEYPCRAVPWADWMKLSFGDFNDVVLDQEAFRLPHAAKITRSEMIGTEGRITFGIIGQLELKIRFRVQTRTGAKRDDFHRTIIPSGVRIRRLVEVTGKPDPDNLIDAEGGT